MDSIYLVITTLSSKEEAIKIAKQIIENQLGACVQIQEPCTSIYKWNGIVETSVEFPMHIKTSGFKKEALEAFIKENHSYEVPEIMAIKLSDVSKDYADWITTQTNGISQS